jgi:hypothetical protein
MATGTKRSNRLSHRCEVFSGNLLQIVRGVGFGIWRIVKDQQKDRRIRRVVVLNKINPLLNFVRFFKRLRYFVASAFAVRL